MEIAGFAELQGAFQFRYFAVFGGQCLPAAYIDRQGFRLAADGLLPGGMIQLAVVTGAFHAFQHIAKHFVVLGQRLPGAPGNGIRVGHFTGFWLANGHGL